MSASECLCRQWPRSFGCSQSSRRFGCNAGVLASITVGFLSSYSGYRGANGISDRNAENERKHERDRLHLVPPHAEPFFQGYCKRSTNQVLSNQIHRFRSCLNEAAGRGFCQGL
jgi:hypothetical protein